MSIAKTHALTLEISPERLEWRAYEILPALLSWGTLIGLAVLAFVIPFWIALFIIVYDFYILIRAFYMSVHLVYAYRRLRREQDVDWLGRCQGASHDVAGYVTIVRQEYESARRAHSPRRIRRRLADHLEHIESLVARKVEVYPWQRVHHIVILPTYNESLTVLRTSLESLVSVNFPHDRLHVVVGFEKRAGTAARQRAAQLNAEFSQHFATFLTTMHPDNLPGEARVKSANATWALKAMEQALADKRIPVDDILVSNFDSDTVVHPSYFGSLTYTFITHPDRWHASYQPLPIYNNNVWDAPAFSRVIAAGSTFWQMIESTRPERLVTFSSHSMTLRALRDVGYWQRHIVSEDSRIFWQCLVHYSGHYQTVPLYTTVSMDAALADNWWQTFKNQYKQKRRWAWGIENFPYIAYQFRRSPSMPRIAKWRYIFRTLEGHHSWATAPIIIAGLGWLPIFFGGPEFHSTVLSYNLPFVARTIMTVAMAGLLISAVLTFLLLPPRPADYSPWRYLTIVIQWVLVPVIATLLSAFPALDAETRLMFNRDLNFNVMQKSRRRASPP